MKTLLPSLILALIASLSAASASEFQTLDGEEAYKLYLSLPGVRCIEWNSKDSIVYTKYQTQSCDEDGKDTDWTCTLQINKMDTQNKYESASCIRQVP
jgi:hypothetical protein